ncbi:hypothetical protein [Xanthobacter sp. KR7-225]|uniref:hypothetical protein n=1 Tax=Xanthobacter sp. KR7-225 TaxID=3156613 RepID=UPI0032B39623
MSAKILPFEPRPVSRIVIDAGTVTASPFPHEMGQYRFFVTFVDPDGCSLGIWDGASYDEARRVASEWEREGARLVDRSGRLH